MTSRIAAFSCRIATLAVLGAVGACQGADVVAPDASKVTFTIVGGNGQSAPVNTRLPVALRARVTNRSGHPVPNFVLNFVVTAGGGSVFGGAEETNAQGYADEVWTLGPRLGPQTVEARAVDPASGVAASYGNFTATGLPPNNIRVVITNDTGVAIMNADGSNFNQLTHGGFEFFPGVLATAPSLSPDHKVIVFTSNREPGGLWRINADGSNLSPLNVGGSAPQWSPDGTRIVYVGGGDPAGSSDLWITGPTGGTGTRITFGAWAGHPAWSPDGSQIVFEGGSEFKQDEISVLKFNPEIVTDGSNIVQLTNTAPNGYNKVPVWSPDGAHILFVADGLEVIDPDGNNRHVLNSGDFSYFIRSSWSPDGTLIGTTEGLMNADGTNLVPINGGAEGDFPWR